MAKKKKKEELTLPAVLSAVGVFIALVFWRVSVRLALDSLPFNVSAAIISLFVILVIFTGPRPLKWFTENKKVHIATKWIVWLTTWASMTALLSGFTVETLSVILLISFVAHIPIKK